MELVKSNYMFLSYIMILFLTNTFIIFSQYEGEKFEIMNNKATMVRIFSIESNKDYHTKFALNYRVVIGYDYINYLGVYKKLDLLFKNKKAFPIRGVEPRSCG